MKTDDKKIVSELELLGRRISKRIDEEREMSFKIDDKYKVQLQKVKENLRLAQYQFEKYLIMATTGD